MKIRSPPSHVLPRLRRRPGRSRTRSGRDRSVVPPATEAQPGQGAPVRGRKVLVDWNDPVPTPASPRMRAWKVVEEKPMFEGMALSSSPTGSRVASTLDTLLILSRSLTGAKQGGVLA